MKLRTIPLLAVLLSVIAVPVDAQQGRWSRFGAKHMGEALIRESDGGYLDEVKGIVLDGGDVNWQLEPSGLTPLMAAAARGHLDVVLFLLEKGADPSLKDRDGRTALDRARQFGQNHVVRALAGAANTGTANAGSAGAQPQRPATAAPPQPNRPQPGSAPSRPAAPPSSPPAASAAGPTRWAPHGTYRKGDRVQFRRANGWFPGTVSEVGPVGDRNPKGPGTYDRKYRIADDRYPGHDGDWHHWGTVAGLSREPFWTGFFIGEWRLGEVSAINTRHQGDLEITEISFLSAPEALRVSANGTYEWKALGVPLIRGRWTPAQDGPGIVLLKGHRGLDWTLRNETNASEEDIRGIESARLSAEGVLSIRANRPREKAAGRQ